MACVSPYYHKDMDKSFPCGQCIACRIRRASTWSMRVLHESSLWPKSVFVTLTYAPEHVPDNYSLVKADLQKYFKRLRWQLKGQKIKYFACGEYGDKYHRPHYHAIIFGLSQKDKVVEDSWPFGYVHTGTVTYDSIQYVAKYVTKKITGKLAKQAYEETGREPPFQLCSQRLGFEYAKDRINVDTATIFHRGKEVPIPRYYREKMGISPDVYREFINASNVQSMRILKKRNPDILHRKEAYDWEIRKSLHQHNNNLKAKTMLKHGLF